MTMTRLLSLLALLTALLGGAAVATAGSFLPEVPKATGEIHPEGNDFWRKNHMDLMRHDRDLTMRQGERDVQASLGACFDCHSVKNETGDYLTVADERHFCRSCHDFAAVRVDCFMCHRSTPGEDNPNLVMSAPDEPNSIAAYLGRVAAEGSE
jgi:predicted CXXCH cytochrome family protein